MFHHLISSICLIALFSVTLAKQVKLEQREPWSHEQKNIKGIQLQTLCYRAPEILLSTLASARPLTCGPWGVCCVRWGVRLFARHTKDHLQ